MIRKIAKFIIWMLVSVLGLALLLYLVVVLVNWKDEPPSPQSAHFAKLSAQLPKVADDRNAFIYLVGMSVDRGYDPLQAGLAMISKESRRSSTTYANGYSHPDYPQGNAVKISTRPVLDLFDACRSIDSQCLVFLASRKAESIVFGPPEQLLLERYRTLIGFPDWRENYMTLNGPIPSYSSALNGQKLALFDCWRNSDARDVKHVAEFLEADARFWRSVFDSSDSLITSMIAVSAMRRNLLWTNLIIHRATNNHFHIEIPVTWLRPIGDDERIMERTWVGEWIFAESVLSNIQNDGFGMTDSAADEFSFVAHIKDRFMRPLFQPQDTINRRAESLVDLMKHYRVPYQQLPQVESRVKESSQGFGGEGLSFPHMFYNPVGKILNEIAKPSYDGYMLAAANLEGARRALLAAVKLREERTSSDKAAEALSNLPFRNPYTNEPFKWDEATGSVVFEGLGEGKGRRYSFVY